MIHNLCYYPNIPSSRDNIHRSAAHGFQFKLPFAILMCTILMCTIFLFSTHNVSLEFLDREFITSTVLTVHLWIILEVEIFLAFVISLSSCWVRTWLAVPTIVYPKREGLSCQLICVCIGQQYMIVQSNDHVQCVIILSFDVTVAYEQAFEWFSWATTCIWQHLLGNRRHKTLPSGPALRILNHDNQNEQVSHKSSSFLLEF